VSDPAVTLRDFLDWTKAVHGGGATVEMHRELVRAERPYPTWDEADAAFTALTAGLDEALVAGAGKFTASEFARINDALEGTVAS
jgi:hypothetical protein